MTAPAATTSGSRRGQIVRSVAIITLLIFAFQVAAFRRSKAQPIDVIPAKFLVDAPAIARRWGLESDSAITLLEEQLHRDVHYNPERDFLFFDHRLKTGGTSFSFVLRDTIGGVFPGSEASDYFPLENATKVIKLLIQDGTIATKNKVMYSHTRLTGDVNVNLTTLIRSSLPDGHKKRFRLLTMVRDPMLLLASHLNEWMCHFGMLNQNQNGTCLETNLTKIRETNIVFLREKCKNKAFASSGSNVITCRQVYAKDPFPQCDSVRGALEAGLSAPFSHLHNSCVGLLAKLTPLEFVMTKWTVDTVEKGALTYLGGIDPPALTNDLESIDFAWFGITERYHESMCDFFYTFRQQPISVPRERVYGCRPISLWTEEDKQFVREKEWLDYTVYRAANAILDTRLEKMRREIQAAIDRKDTIALEYVGPSCFPMNPKGRRRLWEEFFRLRS
jgi:hypothetical protein